jgi:hypothetical protein
MKHWALVLVVTLVTASSACTSERPEAKPTTRTADPTEVIDQDLMIALSKAKNFHHKARVYMSDGKLVEATASVREILSLRFPPTAPEAEDVRNDARALLAKLLVGQGQVEEAMTVVTEGIAQSQRESSTPSRARFMRRARPRSMPRMPRTSRASTARSTPRSRRTTSPTRSTRCCSSA